MLMFDVKVVLGIPLGRIQQRTRRVHATYQRTRDQLIGVSMPQAMEEFVECTVDCIIAVSMPIDVSKPLVAEEIVEGPKSKLSTCPGRRSWKNSSNAPC